MPIYGFNMMATADFNNDGKLDIALCQESGFVVLLAKWRWLIPSLAIDHHAIGELEAGGDVGVALPSGNGTQPYV